MSYRMKEAGWIAGRHYEADENVPLTDEQLRYEGHKVIAGATAVTDSASSKRPSKAKAEQPSEKSDDAVS